MRLDELAGQLTVAKVKAHLTYQDVLEGKTTWTHWIGNGIADLAAKAACDHATRLSPCPWVHSAWLQASAYYKYAARFAPQWVPDSET